MKKTPRDPNVILSNESARALSRRELATVAAAGTPTPHPPDIK
jgi:hypothetical protein